MRPILVATALAAFLAAGEARAEKIVLVAGGGSGGDGGPATAAKLLTPFGVAFDADGNLFFVEMTGQRVREIDSRGVLTTVAGTGGKGDGGDGGPGRAAEFNGMHSLVMAPDGALLLADTWNNRVRKLDLKADRVSTLAGEGSKAFGGDGGPAAQAKFGGLYAAALDPKGRGLYLADLDNRRIRRVDLASGVVTTVAGNGQRGVPDDNADARQAPLLDPRAVAVDGDGNVWVLERGGHALRVVDANGKVRTVVGTGKAGNGGDGGPGRQASLNGPKHLCVDRDGSIVIADTENHRVRRYLPKEDKVVPVAGSGVKGKAGVGGEPLKCEMNQPHGVTVHADGTLYIADSTNNRILRIER